MINLGQENRCICTQYNSYPDECINQYQIMEKGKSVKLAPKNNSEKSIVIILDKCVINDNNTKCDALFLYNSTNKKVSFLTELKGAGDIEHAFEQLSYTKTTTQKYIIVTNGIINSNEKERLENLHNIRVSQILHSEASTPVPDLRSYV